MLVDNFLRHIMCFLDDNKVHPYIQNYLYHNTYSKFLQLYYIFSKIFHIIVIYNKLFQNTIKLTHVIFDIKYCAII